MPTSEELLAQQAPAPLAPVAPVVAAPQTQQTVSPMAPKTPPVPYSPLLSTVNASDVYAAPNIQRIDIPSTKKAMDMKLSDLEKKLAKANSIAELNQISIINQPKAMGVLTGEAAYREKLDTARVNAFNSLYNAKLLNEQRKEEKRQKFISTYGADPNQRPKGMSKREFAAALTGGKFTNLLTTEERLRRAELNKTTSPSLTAGERMGSVLATAQQNLMASRGNDQKVNPNTYLSERAKFMQSGGLASEFDKEYGSLLSPQEQKNLGVSVKTAGGADISSLPASAKDDIATMDTVSNMAGQITSQQTLPGVGAWGYGTLSKFAYQSPFGKAFGIASDQGETNRNLISNIKGTIAKLRGGTSFTPNEQTLLDQYTPTIDDSEATIRTKLASLQKFIDIKRHNTLLANGVADPTWGEQDVNEILNSK